MEKRLLNSDEILEQIFYYMNQLISEKNFNNTILILTDLGKTIVNADRGSLWYRDSKKGTYWTLAASGTDRIEVEEGTGIVGACIRGEETIIINAPYDDERFNPEVDKRTGYVTRSIICMPITDSQGSVIGAYQAINKLGEESSFDDSDAQRLSLAAVYCGRTLENYLLRRESRVDPLTGLLNRRGFFEEYDGIRNHLFTGIGEEAGGGSARNRDALYYGIVMCDIDFFKKVNDTYGHNAGDAVLVQVSRMLTSKVDPEDVICRWGGEEFIILLRGCNVDKTIEVAERIRHSIENSPCIFEGQEIKITMSFGVDCLQADMSAEDNVKKADELLYTAKQTGRNKVVSRR